MAEEFLEVKISLADRVSFFHPEEIGISATGIRLTPSSGTSPTYLYWEEWDKLSKLVEEERKRRGW